MIRVTHGEEPPELAECRRKNLARLRLDWKKIEPDDVDAVAEFCKRHKPDFRKDYRAAAQAALRRRWGHKCAYCGAVCNESDPIDHFRPQLPHDHEHGGYWWLSWTWQNLLPACTTCNGHKQHRFPVTGQRLRPFEDDTTREQAVLVDPSHEDPLKHFVYFFDAIAECWTMQGVGLRGRETAKLLQLDRSDDRYSIHLDLLESVVTRLREMEALSVESLRRCWQVEMDTFFPPDREKPQQPFPALTQAYFRWHMKELMAKYGLELPRLGDVAVEDGAALSRARVNPYALPQELLDAIDALGGKPKPEKTQAVVLDLLNHRESWTLAELAALLGRKPTSLLNGHIRPLAKKGRLTYDPKNQSVSGPSPRRARKR